jgi:hypothetical protein
MTEQELRTRALELAVQLIGSKPNDIVVGTMGSGEVAIKFAKDFLAFMTEPKSS